MASFLPDQKASLLFQNKRIFNVLAKRFLFLLEDLQNEHEIHFAKLERNLPEEFEAVIEQANYFDKNKFVHYRKRILDCIGDAYRESVEEMERIK